MKHIVVRGADDGVEKLPFPGASDMNARLRKLITAYQKSYKKEMIKLEQSEKVETLIPYLQDGIWHLLFISIPLTSFSVS